MSSQRSVVMDLKIISQERLRTFFLFHWSRRRTAGRHHPRRRLWLLRPTGAGKDAQRWLANSPSKSATRIIQRTRPDFGLNLAFHDHFSTSFSFPFRCSSRRPLMGRTPVFVRVGVGMGRGGRARPGPRCRVYALRQPCPSHGADDRRGVADPKQELTGR